MAKEHPERKMQLSKTPIYENETSFDIVLMHNDIKVSSDKNKQMNGNLQKLALYTELKLCDHCVCGTGE